MVKQEFSKQTVMTNRAIKLLTLEEDIRILGEIIDEEDKIGFIQEIHNAKSLLDFDLYYSKLEEISRKYTIMYSVDELSKRLTILNQQ